MYIYLIIHGPFIVMSLAINHVPPSTSNEKELSYVSNDHTNSYLRCGL